MGHSAKSNTLLLGLLILLVVGACIVYTVFDPSQAFWMPKCPFRLLTGWNCPACGLQRAFHALLHGHLAEALSYNYFFVVSIPYAVVLLVSEGMKLLHRGEAYVRAAEHPVIARVYVVLFLIWGVARNLLGI